MKRWMTFFVAATLIASGWRPAEAQEEIGKRRRARIAIQWVKMQSKNYAFQYESVIPTSTVKRVASELEDVLVQYKTVFKYTPKEPFKVKFLDSVNTYEQEGGDLSHPGFFNASSGYLVIRQLPFYQLIPTVYHEALHQYLQAYIGKNVRIPTWFNEGVAVYFEGMQRDKPKKKLSYKLIDNRRLAQLKDALFTRSAIPLQKLIDATGQEFHEKEKEGLYYSESFAVIYFLMQGLRGKPVFDYAKELKKTGDVELANVKIFGKDRKKLKRIEKTWKGYMLRVKIQKPR